MQQVLPLDQLEWKEWRAEVLRRLRDHGATRNCLRFLVEQGCDREELLFRLAALAAWWKRKLPSLASEGLTRHQVKEAPRKFRNAADLIDRLRRLRYLLPQESPDVAVALCATAAILEGSLPFRLRPDRASLGVAALCVLINYVKQSSEGFHDEQLSGLIAAVLGSDNYAATHLTQWRSKHREELAQAENCVVSPIGIPVGRR